MTDIQTTPGRERPPYAMVELDACVSRGAVHCQAYIIYGERDAVYECIETIHQARGFQTEKLGYFPTECACRNYALEEANRANQAATKVPGKTHIAMALTPAEFLKALRVEPAPEAAVAIDSGMSEPEWQAVMDQIPDGPALAAGDTGHATTYITHRRLGAAFSIYGPLQEVLDAMTASGAPQGVVECKRWHGDESAKAAAEFVEASARARTNGTLHVRTLPASEYILWLASNPQPRH